MTITQRIELRRLGYTKEEINELAELEKIPVQEPEPEAVPEPEPVQMAIDLEPEKPDVQSQLLTAINNLTTVLQTQKLNNSAQPEQPKKESVEDIFTNILKG